MTTQEEKKNQRIAMLTSIGIHGALFLMFLFMVAWRPPNPPLPEVGLEINFGMDDQGSGEIQPEEEVGSQGTQPEEKNQPEPQQEARETPQATPEKPVEQEVETAKDETPVAIKQEKKEPPTPEKVVDKVPPKKEEPVKEPDPNGGFNEKSSKNTKSNNTSTDGKSGTAASQGDDKNKVGDKGDPAGKLDAKGGYGGGGGGHSLELAGWKWDNAPDPKIPKSESGRIVFQIKVDDAGEIVSITTLERSVSLEAEKACREEVQRLTFTKTGTNVPEFSTGKITFVITSK